MKLRNWLIGACALLTASTAHAQGETVPYATVGAWEIATEPARDLCKMFRYYGSSVDEHVEGLTVRYDAARDLVGLSWSTDGSTPFPVDGRIDLHLSFMRGKSIDDSWGSRPFQHRKPEKTRYFATLVKGPKEPQRMLRDMAGNQLIAFYLGPVLLTALSLEAAEATAKLRECASKIAPRPAAAPRPL